MMNSMTARQLREHVKAYNAKAGFPMTTKTTDGTHMCTYFTTGFVDLGKPELLMPIAHESVQVLFQTAVRSWAGPDNYSCIVVKELNMAFSIVAFDSADLEREAKCKFMGFTLRYCGARSCDVRLVIPSFFGLAGPRSESRITVTKARLCAVCHKHSFGARSCGCCRSRWYCSKECQRVDWRTHKTCCTVPSAEMTCTCCSRVHTIPTGKNKKTCHQEMCTTASKFTGVHHVNLVTDNGTYIDINCLLERVAPWLIALEVE
jgi:hypothetical protein